MGIKIDRKKPRLIWASFFYRLHTILPLNNKAKFKLYLNMTAMFERLSHQMSFKNFGPHNHPHRTHARIFRDKFLNKEFTVLDLGCATGDISNELAEKTKKVVGIDHNPVSVKEASRKHQRENLEFYQGDAQEFLQKNNAKFDLLILSHILEHLDNPKDFLLKFKDYFGYIYIEVPDFDKTYLNHYRKELNMRLIYTDDDHVSEFDRYELLEILKECNITVVEALYRFGIQHLWCKVEK